MIAYPTIDDVILFVGIYIIQQGLLFYFIGWEKIYKEPYNLVKRRLLSEKSFEIIIDNGAYQHWSLVGIPIMAYWIHQLNQVLLFVDILVLIIAGLMFFKIMDTKKIIHIYVANFRPYIGQFTLNNSIANLFVFPNAIFSSFFFVIIFLLLYYLFRSSFFGL
ncbi:MAG: hypothetical protein HGA85_02475 [Nanoarchaeota archaeon]|nr:hypothetical protein [Nanoarchaeota archaeon]